MISSASSFRRLFPMAVLPFVIGSLSAEIFKTSGFKCEIKDLVGSTVIKVNPIDSEQAATLRLDWKPVGDPPENFQSEAEKGNVHVSTYRLGKTTVTRTVMVSEKENAIFIHALADQPGAISLTAKFETSKPVSIDGRRELVFRTPEVSAHAWILPFESDTEDDGKSVISVSGEGEILIIVALSGDPGKASASETFSRLGKKYDPNQHPPSPHLIWKGVNLK